jgi:hypothetical protein
MNFLLFPVVIPAKAGINIGARAKARKSSTCYRPSSKKIDEALWLDSQL